MKYIYKITGKVSLILYIFMLYQFWHLCQYGGLRRHIPMLALDIIGLVGTVVLWLISKRHNQEVNSGDNGNKKLFYTEMILLIQQLYSLVDVSFILQFRITGHCLGNLMSGCVKKK